LTNDLNRLREAISARIAQHINRVIFAPERRQE